MWRDTVLRGRRAIEPRRNFLTLPAGYLEEHETTAAGARREAEEEACADIAIEALLAVYNIPRISQVQLIYKARLRNPDVAPGVESLEVGRSEERRVGQESAVRGDLGGRRIITKKSNTSTRKHKK